MYCVYIYIHIYTWHYTITCIYDSFYNINIWHYNYSILFEYICICTYMIPSIWTVYIYRELYKNNPSDLLIPHILRVRSWHPGSRFSGVTKFGRSSSKRCAEGPCPFEVKVERGFWCHFLILFVFFSDVFLFSTSFLLRLSFSLGFPPLFSSKIILPEWVQVKMHRHIFYIYSFKSLNFPCCSKWIKTDIWMVFSILFHMDTDGIFPCERGHPLQGSGSRLSDVWAHCL